MTSLPHSLGVVTHWVKLTKATYSQAPYSECANMKDMMDKLTSVRGAKADFLVLLHSLARASHPTLRRESLR